MDVPFAGAKKKKKKFSERERLRGPVRALDPDTTYVNFGFWGAVERDPGGERDGDHRRNKLVERLVSDLGGRKSLYCDIFL